MNNYIYDAIEINVNENVYKVNLTKDIREGILKVYLPLNGSEDFNSLIEIINKYNPATNILQYPWENAEEEVLICDRKINQIDYRILCDLVTNNIQVNFITNGKEESEEFVRKYISVVFYHVLAKKNKGLNNEVRSKC